MRTRVVNVASDSDEDDITEVVDIIADSDTDGVEPKTRPGVPPLRFHGYRRGRELGRGASGRVFVCNKKGRSGGFAVKAVDLRRMQLSSNVESEHRALLREFEILKCLPPHPSIVQMVDAFEEGDWFLLVLELVGGGDLFTALTARDPPRLLEPECAFVLRQLADGLSFLHKQGCIHRDLKLENVLVASERKKQGLHLYTVKITDFGLSKTVGTGLSEAYSVVGTQPYTAPEVMSGGAYDFSSDLWCLGVLMYVLLVGHYPFDSVCACQAEIDNVLQKVAGSDLAKSVVANLLRLDPKERLPLTDICNHELIKQCAEDVSVERKAKRQCTTITESPQEPSSIIPKGNVIKESVSKAPQKSIQPAAVGSEAAEVGKEQPQQPQASGVGEWLAYIYGFSKVSSSSATAEDSAPVALADSDEVFPTISRSERSDVMLVHMAIPERFAPSVWGKPSSCTLQMRQLAAVTGCIARGISRASMSNQLLMIVGNFQQCAIVQEIVHSRLREATLDTGEGAADQVEIVLFVRTEAAGMITGKHGFVLKQIRKKYGAKIQLLREQIRGHRPCILAGTFQSVLQAQRHVFDLVRAVPFAAPLSEVGKEMLERTPPRIAEMSTDDLEASPGTDPRQML